MSQENEKQIAPNVKHAPVKPIPLTTLITTDLVGITRGRSFPTKEIDDYWETGCGWVPAASALTPHDIGAETNPWSSLGDLRLVPDRNTRVFVSNGPDPTAPPLDFIHCDLVETDGALWDCCPRTLLRKEIQHYHDVLGMKVIAAFEHEFTLDGRPSNSHLPSFSLQAHRHVDDFAGWVVGALDSAGVQPEVFLREYGQYQYELSCRPTEGIAVADRAVNFREVTRDIARQMNMRACFSPIPYPGAIGNGVHLHISFRNLEGKPLLYDKERPYELSGLGEHWAAGVLHHLPALCAFTAPTPISYLRLKPHRWSAGYGCLGYRNREVALRISPTVSIGNRLVDRQYNLEFRPFDATACPHLGMAALLIAGRLGIQQKLKLDTIVDIDPHQMSVEEREKRHIRALPLNLSSALEMLSKDTELIRELPKSLLDTYFAVKQQEIKDTSVLSEKELCELYAKIY